MKTLKKLLVPVVILCVLAAGCKKDKDNEPTPTPTPSNPTFSSTTNPEVGFKINGAAVTYKNGGNIHQGLSTGASWGPNFITSTPGAYISEEINSTTTRTWFSIDKGILMWPTGNSLDTNTWKSFFATGSYSYVSQNFNPNGNPIEHGVIIGMEDSNGVYWSTIKGSADQAGSTFNITQSLFFMYWGEKYMKVKFTFNCKVYDDAGNMKTITDGSGVLDFNTEY